MKNQTKHNHVRHFWYETYKFSGDYGPFMAFT